jgi:hypothetical protein
MTFAEASAKQWEEIVEQARHLRKPVEEIAAHFADKNTSQGSIKGRVKAIRWALTEAGWTVEKIVEEGQTAVRSAYERSKRNGEEPNRIVRWAIPVSLAEAIQWSKRSSPDAEESLTERFHRLGIKRSVEFFEFIHSTFADMDDEEILNRRGAFTEKDAPKRRRK